MTGWMLKTKTGKLCGALWLQDKKPQPTLLNPTQYRFVRVKVTEIKK